jgi:hypothetical protein
MAQINQLVIRDLTMALVVDEQQRVRGAIRKRGICSVPFRVTRNRHLWNMRRVGGVVERWRHRRILPMPMLLPLTTAR